MEPLTERIGSSQTLQRGITENVASSFDSLTATVFASSVDASSKLTVFSSSDEEGVFFTVDVCEEEEELFWLPPSLVVDDDNEDTRFLEAVERIVDSDSTDSPSPSIFHKKNHFLLSSLAIASFLILYIYHHVSKFGLTLAEGTGVFSFFCIFFLVSQIESQCPTTLPRPRSSLEALTLIQRMVSLFLLAS